MTANAISIFLYCNLPCEEAENLGDVDGVRPSAKLRPYKRHRNPSQGTFLVTQDIIYLLILVMKFYTMPNVKLISRALKGTRRPASTLASGRAQLLQKNPDDIVVTFAKRTAMGRSKKGQLKDVPVDELLHALFKVRV